MPFQYGIDTYPWLRDVIDQFAGPDHGVELAIFGDDNKQVIEVFCDLPREIRARLKHAYPQFRDVRRLERRGKVAWNTQ